MKKSIISMFMLIAVFVGGQAKAAEWIWNGYLGINYEDDTRPKKPGSFDTFILSIISNVNVSQNLHFLSQVDWEHAPYFEARKVGDNKELSNRSTGELTLSKAYAEYILNDHLSVIAGKFFNPIGLQNLAYYNVPAYPYMKIPRESVYKKEGTDKIDFSNDAAFYQRYAQGLWVKGFYGFNKIEFNYDVTLSNGRSVFEHTDDNEDKGVSGRLQIAFPSLPIKFSPLLSFYRDEYIVSGDKKNQMTFIPGFEFETGNLTVVSEYANSRLRKSDSLEKEFTAIYVDVYYTVAQRFTPYFRYEFYDPDIAISNDKEKEITVGMAYHVKLWEILLKAQVRMHNSDNKNQAHPYFNVYGVGTAFGF